jgi:hypothetical protein
MLASLAFAESLQKKIDTYHLRAWHFVEHVAGSGGNIIYF